VAVAQKHKTGHLVPNTTKFSDQDMSPVPPGMYHPRSVAWELIRYSTFSWRESNPLLWSRDGLETRVHSSLFCPGLGVSLETWSPRSRSWSRDLKKVLTTTPLSYYVTHTGRIAGSMQQLTP